MADMDLRDEFAAMAMTALLNGANAGSHDNVPPMLAMIARYSYMLADAMLKARQEGEA